MGKKYTTDKIFMENGSLDINSSHDGSDLTVLSISSSGQTTFNNGQITLGGTGRIQGVDTVDADTDAANKAYVDAAVSGGGGGNFLPLSGGTLTGPLAGTSATFTGDINIGTTDNIIKQGDNDQLDIFADSGFEVLSGDGIKLTISDVVEFTGTSTIGFGYPYLATFDTFNLTTGRNYTLPNQAGTIALVGNIPTNNNQLTNGAGYIGGSGSTNYIPMFTPNGTTIGNSAMFQANIGTGTAKRITVAGARMTITGSGGDADGGTLNLASSSARLGIAVNSYPSGITEPEASLDVGKNARIRGSLNVGSTNEQYLFVSTTGDTPVGYVRMSYYGQGTDYDLSGGAQSSVQYTTGFSNGGKISEDERIMTFKFTRAQIAALGNAYKTLIPADSNFNYIVKEAYMYQVNETNGLAPLLATNSKLVIQYASTTGGVLRYDNAFELSSTPFNQSRYNRKVMFFQGIECAQVGGTNTVPRAEVRLGLTNLSSSAGNGTVDYYLRLRVKNIDFNDDIKNNSQLIVVA